MAELLLVRHGETEWSRDGLHTSWTDKPLTARGERQAAALRPLLAARRVGHVLVSPLARARRTAELAGLRDAVVEPGLREWDYGGYEGVTTAEIHRTRPDWFLFDDGVVPGPAGHPGESPAEAGARADRVLARIGPWLDEDGGDVVLVGHAHFLRVLTARRLGLPPAAGALFRLDTGTVSRIGTEHGRPALVAWNAAGAAPARDAAVPGQDGRAGTAAVSV
ncbi:histidine phosphatase family protein [Streptomyces sp. AV19]|uniref:histidine phosphatase family protein n=1 Tax=Streptomyces sp. AV19 TaxID=2793068 RepID=UPI0018FED3A2|nr:histidine phosphatase family protein [Streptomyces sp. AV19]MBH1933335.1 histidine phosphatase family protein [Streptomyces sp. AV19]MDG4531946.1 histidine phosphatase family protein [Streptomyces sp. AV19]